MVSIIVSGTKLNKNTLTISQKGKFTEDIYPLDVFQIDEQQQILSPCDQHPAGETFNQCFKREWDAFCDGLVGCLTQATNPHLVAIAITIHCLAC